MRLLQAFGITGLRISRLKALWQTGNEHQVSSIRRGDRVVTTPIKWFKIYAGVGGSFGGAKYIGTYPYERREQAENAAYEEAWNAYESYSSRIRVRSIETIMDEDGLDEEQAAEAYREEVEPWLSYHVEEIDGPRRLTSNGELNWKPS